MPISQPPDVAIQAYLAATTKHTRRVEIYEQDGVTRWAKDIEPRLIDGSVTVDYTRDERRGLDLTLSNSDGVLQNAPGEFWYDKIIKVFRGVEIRGSARPPKILIISDDPGGDLVPAFRSVASAFGYGDVRVNPLVATVAEMAGYEIVVSLTPTTVAKNTLLRDAYNAGYRVMSFGGGVSEYGTDVFGVGSFDVGPVQVSADTIQIAPQSITHELASGWSAFGYEFFNRTNLVPNPSFESGGGWAAQSGGSLSRVFSDVHSGGACLKFDSAAAYSSGPVTTPGGADGIPVLPETPYTASAWIKADAGVAIRLYITYWDEAGVFIGESYNTFTSASATWERVHYNDISLTSARFARVGIRQQDAVARTFYVDDVMLEKSDMLGDYFDGDTPGAYWAGTANNSASKEGIVTGLPSTVTSPRWTPISQSGSTTFVSAFEEPTKRWFMYHPPALAELYSVPQFANLVRRALNWLNPVVFTNHWEAQIGEFMIDRISEPHFPHNVTVIGRDYTKKCMLSKFPHATQFASGMLLQSIISAIAGAAGITKRIISSDIVVDRQFFFERGVSRWEAIKEIANAYNYEIFFDATGYLTMRLHNDPATTPPVIVIKTGKDGQVASYSKSTTDVQIFNHIIVTGESSDTAAPPVWSELKNENPDSPTSIAEIGDRIFEYSSSFITTQAQADALAASFLAIHSLEEFELSFETLMLPWLEAGDIVGWLDPNPAPGDPTTFLLSTITLPLGLAPMSSTAKRITNVGS